MSEPIYYPPWPGAAPPRPPMKGKWVAAGIGIAILGHLLSIVPAIPVLSADTATSGSAGTAALVLLIAQGVLFIGCLVGGILLLSLRNGNRGLGLGLLIGWAVGLLVVPVVGFGLCVQAIG